MQELLSESVVLSHCKQTLRLLEGYGLLTWRRITVSGIPRAGGKFYTKNTDMEGMSDLLVFLPCSKVLHVECKSSKGRPTPSQIKWQEKLASLGHNYVIARSCDDLIHALRSLGVSHWSFRRQVG